MFKISIFSADTNELLENFDCPSEYMACIAVAGVKQEYNRVGIPVYSNIVGEDYECALVA